MINSTSLDENSWFPTNKCFINNEWETPSTEQYLKLLNPSDGDLLAFIARGAIEDVNRAIKSAENSLENEWGNYSAADRGRILTKMSNLVKDKIEKLAVLESLDVGKPLKQARTDAIALSKYLEFYGGATNKIHGNTIPFENNFTVFSLREKYGITAHIIPWNYPMQIIGRSISASLAMGNSCILKPAEEACLTALAFGQIALEAGLPPGALSIIPGYGEEVGSVLTHHPGVNHISFTGSLETGVQVQKAAAENVVPTTLELGGKSPQIVFDDCDLESAVPYLVNAGIQNAGQTCSASSRILVQEPLLDKVISLMSKAYSTLKVGPALEDLDLGPLISKRQLDFVNYSISQGEPLPVVAEGTLTANAPRTGHFFKPKLLFKEDTKHFLCQEEIFGPIQIIIPFKNEKEAIRLANETGYGLVASVWTENGGRQMRMARAIKAGQIFINNYGAGGGIELPFGGTGKSGHGREKGFESLYGFSQLKTVAVFHGKDN